MTQILLLTDRPQEERSSVSLAFTLADRLHAKGVAAVVTRSEDALLSSGMLFGIPDSGLLPQQMPPTTISGDDQGADATDRLFDYCRQESMCYGVNYETIRTKTSLRRAAATLASAVGLLLVRRELLIDDKEEVLPLRMLWSEAAAPLLICPTDAPPWERIVVAATDGIQRERLIAWGSHWAHRFDVALGIIELRPSSPRSAWSALSRWLSRKSSRNRRAALSEGLLTCGLGPRDLLLVERGVAEWPFPSGVCDADLADLVSATPCALGVVPTFSNAATRELLYPEGLTSIDESAFGIIAA